MELQDYVNRIKFQLTGGILESELEDKNYEEIVNYCIREINNYYNVSELIEVDASSCIDLVKYPQINNIIGVHRTTSISAPSAGVTSDPFYVAYYQAYTPYGYSQD